MTNRLGLAVTVLGVALLVASSVGVSTIALERQATIGVADSAVVEFDEIDPTVEAGNGSDIELIDVTNQADTSLTVSAVVGADDTATIDDVRAGGKMDPGETATVTADATCEGESEETVPIDVTVSGDGITIERTIEVTIDCTG